MNRFLTVSLLLAGALLASCATPRDGSDTTTYLQSHSEQARKTPAAAVMPAGPPSLPGPTGAARIVYFDFDRSVVRPIDRPIVQANATYLQRNPNARVSLEGSTDAKGGREYNLALGQRRAEAVRSSLVLLGVQDKQIEAVSFGMEKPASLIRSEQGDQLDRRVEFKYR